MGGLDPQSRGKLISACPAGPLQMTTDYELAACRREDLQIVNMFEASTKDGGARFISPPREGEGTGNHVGLTGKPGDVVMLMWLYVHARLHQGIKQRIPVPSRFCNAAVIHAML